jgi:hypothetical protein
MSKRRKQCDDRPGPPLDVRIIRDALVVVIPIPDSTVAAADARLVLRCDGNGDILAAIASSTS